MTARTVVRHLVARNNFRQRHYATLSDQARAAREAWREQRVELTPGAEKGIQCEWGSTEKGKGDDGN